MTFYSLKRIKFIYHGDWSDPEAIYKGKSYNYYDFEDVLFSYFEDCGFLGDIKFKDFIKNNKNLCYLIINENLGGFKEYGE